MWKIYNYKGHSTRVAVAYAVGKSKPEGLSTVYQQEIRYIQENNLKTNPRRMFEVYFHAALMTWKEQGERLLVLWTQTSMHAMED